MKGLSNRQLARKSELQDELQEKNRKVQETIDNFNEKIKKLYREVEQAVDEYNSVVTEIQDFQQEIVDEAREFYNEKSEKWQESEKGLALDGFINEWESSAIGDAYVNEPDEIEINDFEDESYLDNLPDEINQ